MPCRVPRRVRSGPRAAQEVTTFLRVLGCYPKEARARGLASADLLEPIADAAAGAPDPYAASADLLYDLAPAHGGSPQARRPGRCPRRVVPCTHTPHCGRARALSQMWREAVLWGTRQRARGGVVGLVTRALEAVVCMFGT